MRRILPALLLLVALAAYAKNKQSTPVIAAIANARYVAIVPLGANPTTDWLNNPAVTIEDREAGSAVLERLQKWGHYRYTVNPNDADIIIAVRSGRRANVAVGPRISTGDVHIGKSDPTLTGTQDPASPNRRNAGPQVSVNTAADVGPADDVMAIFLGTDTGSAPLWIRRQHDGLAGDLPLFQKFRKDVEETEKTLAASRKP